MAMNISEITRPNTDVVFDPKGSDTMGKDEFLHLLTVQLKHQDPLSPMESADFATQLVSYSSLEQLTNLNTSMTDIQQENIKLNQSISNSLSAGLIGKSVLAESNRFLHDQLKDDLLRFNLKEGAENVTVRITTNFGIPVYEEDLGPMSGGDNEFTWKGFKTTGELAADGQYRFEVIANNAEGANVVNTMSTMGTIEAVRFINGEAVLVVNGIEIPFKDVREIVEPVQTQVFQG